jgi:L-amino acid N-acyltransferase YncA
VRPVEIRVRPARPEDAAGIARVYGEGIRAGTATVVRRAPSAQDIAARLGAAWPVHTWLVTERQGEVVGWAASMPYLSVPEYAGVAEFSVYVAADHQGTGVGRRLMAALLRAAEEAGLYKLTGRVFASNTGSRAVLARVGFREVGTYRRHVRVDGQWRDVVVVEALLGEAALGEPALPEGAPEPARVSQNGRIEPPPQQME